MKTINIHEAKTQLSRLIEEAVNDKPFIIAKAGKPLVKVVALETPDYDEQKRIGFLQGEFLVPDHFDELGKQEIEVMFNGKQ